MSSIHEDFPVHDSLEGIWVGTIATNAATINDPVYVVINDFSKTHRWGPCRWITRGATLPTRGLDCLVTFDNDGEAVVIAWWDGPGGSSGIKNSELVGAGGVLADMPPGRLLTYDQVIAGTLISATSEATSQTIVASTSFVFDGSTVVQIEAGFPDASNLSAWTVTFVLWDDTANVSLGILGALGLAAGLSSGPIHVSRDMVPASGARVFSIRAFRTTSNGSVNAGAGGATNKMPGYIKIRKV